ncbi:hypothetical protein DSM110277_02048 [Sulfitobacter pontiacus]|uniref:Uncharacterized protein n=1 Tax=Sulfitobacter pontiacus TaxID=60137 RepID=A0AAX3ACX6_9RHOB|nr:hypothetical protein [Sulfitobacter pontiacus]UOA23619.1 hypothetical protein DSM110277_02048 [Sulfitobacter pontiacus]
MQTPIDKARHVVTHPEIFGHIPALLAINWEQLKNARGQTVDHDRIGAPAYLITTARIDGADPQAARIRSAVRDYAQTRGYDLPPSAA